MILHPAIIALAKLIYPIKEPNRTRDRPLEVIAVGLPRSGTDSLRTSLRLTGYNESMHGFVFVLDEPGQGPQWCRLAWRKDHTSSTLSPEQRGLGAADFDKILGNCRATTDIPCASFACELIKAYPDAKIIVNKRDEDAWYHSVMKTFGGGSGFGGWDFAMFDHEAFWSKLGGEAVFFDRFGYDFAKNGKAYHRAHYAEIDELLEAEKAAGRERKVLRWQVEDGWSGLSSFLGKDIPSDEKGSPMEFPHGNDAAGLQARIAPVFAVRQKRVKRNRIIVGTLVSGIVLGSLGSLIRRFVL